MVEAYVLIQTEIGKPPQVADAVSKISGVTSAVVVTGPYDVVARLTAADMSSLGTLTASRIQAVEGITRTLTCPVLHL